MLMTSKSACFEYILILLRCKSIAYPYFNNLLTANKRYFLYLRRDKSFTASSS